MIFNSIIFGEKSCASHYLFSFSRDQQQYSIFQSVCKTNGYNNGSVRSFLSKSNYKMRSYNRCNQGKDYDLEQRFYSANRRYSDITIFCKRIKPLNPIHEFKGLEI